MCPGHRLAAGAYSFNQGKFPERACHDFLHGIVRLAQNCAADPRSRRIQVSGPGKAMPPDRLQQAVACVKIIESVSRIPAPQLHCESLRE